MLSLPDDSDFSQLLGKLENTEGDKDQTELLKSFFREKILEEVQEKFEQL